MKVSVIISTYNSPHLLQKVLWGYECQTYEAFELLIADDGSNEETQTLIANFKQKSALNIVHVWHPDNGFQKTAILNKATLAATGDYLIFSDGDCVPRKDFVQIHVSRAKPGNFLSGGYFKLPFDVSDLIAEENIKNGDAFNSRWLVANGLKKSFKLNKLTSEGFTEAALNRLTPTKATWNGHNASGWKADILAVNGFNEQMQYGGEDRELGERLVNKGIKGVQIRYSAICIHLEHARGYISQQALLKNQQIRKETKKFRRVWTSDGIIKSVEV